VSDRCSLIVQGGSFQKSIVASRHSPFYLPRVDKLAGFGLASQRE